jgi:predicted esterase
MRNCCNFRRTTTTTLSSIFINNNKTGNFTTSFSYLTSSFRMASSSSTEDQFSQMKVSDLKAEIDRLGATSKIVSGMEKSDLIEILREAKKNAPAAGGNTIADLVASSFPTSARRSQSLRYGQVAVVGNSTNPSAIVSFCHGLGDTCAGWAQAMEYEIAPQIPHALFILPTAANQAVTMNMGMAMPAWYDIKGLGERASEDPEGVALSCAYLENLVKKACEQYKIPKENRWVVAGFSQGGAVSLSTGLLCKGDVKPAAIAVLSGYLAGREFVVPNIANKDIPIQQFHGTADPMVNLSLATKTKEFLEQGGQCTGILPIKTYRGMQHSSSPQEMEDFTQFVLKMVPPLSKA